MGKTVYHRAGVEAEGLKEAEVRLLVLPTSVHVPKLNKLGLLTNKINLIQRKMGDTYHITTYEAPVEKLSMSIHSPKFRRIGIIDTKVLSIWIKLYSLSRNHLKDLALPNDASHED